MSSANRLHEPKAFIIYDESSSPSAKDYIIVSDWNLPLKNSAETIAVSPAGGTQIDLNFEFQRKKSNLNNKTCFGYPGTYCVC